MATVIKASGVTFTNANLPRIGRFLQDNLLAAWRPNSTPSGLKDMTANKNDLVLLNAPTLTTSSVVGDGKNGLKSAVSSTKSMTIMCVSRLKRTSTSTAWATSYIFGNLVSGVEGTGFYYQPSGDTIAVRGRVNPLNKTTSAVITKDMIYTAHTGQTTTETPWTFFALTIDAVSNIAMLHIPAKAATVSISDSTLDFANRPMSPTNYMYVASNSALPQTSQVEVAEALIYNTALSSEQIRKQYLYTKDALAKQGISI